MQHDVIVVGGGPAGLMTARLLAAQGHGVLVLEEHPEIGQPVHCTGLLGLDAFDELDLPRETILAVVTAAAFRAGTGQPLVIASERVRAAIIDRGAFDAALAARARAAGAEVRCGSRVIRVERTARAMEIHVADTPAPFSARACVLACGASYRFTRALGLGVPRTFVQSAQVQIPFPALDQVQVRLGRDLAPGGFAWVVPFRAAGRSYARIGLMTDRAARIRFARFLEELGQQFGCDVQAVPPPRLKMLPLGPIGRTFAPRLLAVGDAAGLVKPTTGGGIYYSLLSGRLAAETLDETLRADALADTDLRAYEQRWRERLGPEIRIGLAFRALATRLGDTAIHALIELARVDGLVPLLAEAADFNWHRAAALALLRHAAFRRLVFQSWWA